MHSLLYQNHLLALLTRSHRAADSTSMFLCADSFIRLRFFAPFSRYYASQCNASLLSSLVDQKWWWKNKGRIIMKEKGWFSQKKCRKRKRKHRRKSKARIEVKQNRNPKNREHKENKSPFWKERWKDIKSRWKEKKMLSNLSFFLFGYFLTRDTQSKMRGGSRGGGSTNRISSQREK